jgi:rare lipoprotein A
MTAAHRTLPLPTYARVTNLQNGRTVVVRINDRGPFHANRIIDLSYAAAARLGILREGTGLVEVVAVDPGGPEPPSFETGPGGPPILEAEPRLFLQVGAFGDQRNAERLRARLTPALSSTVVVQRLESAPRPLYRVRIGPLDSVDLADSLSGELESLGVADAHLVVE